MSDEGRLPVDGLERVRRLISSACVAKVDQPRSMVAFALLDQLERGLPFGAAVSSVEELVAIRHNQMLIAAGRRGLDDEIGQAVADHRRTARVLMFTPAHVA